MAHTPGPWRVLETRHASGLRFHVVHSDRRPVAAVETGDKGRRRASADASLIAASPALFEACSNWIAWLDSDLWREDAAAYESAMLNAMRAAIAKAKGEDGEASNG